MNEVVRRSFAVSILFGIVFAALQASLLLGVIALYLGVTNARVAQVSSATQAALVAEDLKAGRGWPEIERLMQERHGAVSRDDEMAFFDEGGRLLARSGGRVTRVPEKLPASVLAELGTEPRPIETGAGPEQRNQPHGLGEVNVAVIVSLLQKDW